MQQVIDWPNVPLSRQHPVASCPRGNQAVSEHENASPWVFFALLHTDLSIAEGRCHCGLARPRALTRCGSGMCI